MDQVSSLVLSVVFSSLVLSAVLISLVLSEVPSSLVFSVVYLGGSVNSVIAERLRCWALVAGPRSEGSTQIRL